MAVQKHLANNTPEAIKKRELEAAEKQASKSEQKKYASSTKKLLEDNQKPETFARQRIGSTYLRKRMAANERALELKQQKLEQKNKINKLSFLSENIEDLP